MAMQFNDLADALAETSLIAGKGTIRFACANLEMLAHPVETIKNLAGLVMKSARALNFANETLRCMSIKNNVFQLDKPRWWSDEQYITYQKEHADKLDENIAVIKGVISGIGDEMSKIPKDEMGEHAVAFALDSIFGAKLLAKASSTTANLLKSAQKIEAVNKSVKAAKLVAKATAEAAQDKLGFKKLYSRMIEKVRRSKLISEQLFPKKEIITPQLADFKAPEDQVRHLMKNIFIREAETTANCAIIKDGKRIVDKIRKLENKIPKGDTEFVGEIDSLIKALNSTFQSKLDTTLIDEFKKTFNAFENGKKVNLMFNEKHILIPDAQFKRSTRVVVGGGHSSGSVKAMETVGIIDITAEKELVAGVMEYKFRDLFSGRELLKTEFPSNWSDFKILEAMKEVYFEGAEFSGDSGKYVRYKVIDGIDMHIILKKDGINHTIITFVPAKPKGWA